MTRESSSGEERRERLRIKTALPAWCLVGKQKVSVRIYEISPSGMTLVAPLDMAYEPEYRVQCRLEQGVRQEFDVVERNRRRYRSGDVEVLRIGLEIRTLAEESESFFQDLGAYLKRPSQVKKGTAPDRTYARVPFRLPVNLYISERWVECETDGFSTKGVSLIIPEDMVPLEEVPMTFHEPGGVKLRVTVCEKNRSALELAGKVRVGCRVLDVTPEYRRFLRKYDLWRRE